MIRVHVKLADFLSRITQQPQSELEIAEDSTVADVIGLLANRFGDDFQKALVDSEGKLRKQIVIAMNGVVLAHEKTRTAAVREGSRITIIPVTGGG
ncbi:MAG: MoaD/ThiS family protein [Deltaproteobacteria bacterium]|nr:MAG: MoaD/ThiS family protein [Deltaproteobacteria bacterium]